MARTVGDPRFRELMLAAIPVTIRRLRERQAAGTYAPPAGLDEARASFRAFLSRWQYVNREIGGYWHLGSTLWPSQDELVVLVDVDHVRRMMVLKSGKIGISEVLVALAAWRGVFAESGARVHLFSATSDDAKTLLDIIRIGVSRLPSDWGYRVATDERYGDTTRSLKVRGSDGGVRSFWSYAPRKTASISESAVHVHLDELAHMQWGEAVYNSVVTTVPDDGTLVVLSRGHGVDNYMADLWDRLVPEGVDYRDARASALARLALGDTTTMVPVFQPYAMRPGRDEAWRMRQAETMTPAGLRWFAPEVPGDAMAGDADTEFVDAAQWDALDVSPPLSPDDSRTPIVVALDAGIRSDHFAVVVGTRHPDRHDEVAVRQVVEWVPSPVVDFAEVKAWLRDLRARRNLVCVAYDPYQLEDMAQELGREMYWLEFNQGAPRLKADKGLRDAIVQRRITRPDDTYGGDALRRAVRAAGIKTERSEDALRIVKRAAGKIDALVATSMARAICLELNL